VAVRLRGPEVAEVALELARERVHLVEVVAGPREGDRAERADRAEDDGHDDEGGRDLHADRTVPEPVPAQVLGELGGHRSSSFV